MSQDARFSIESTDDGTGFFVYRVVNADGLAMCITTSERLAKERLAQFIENPEMEARVLALYSQYKKI
jgi:hypothetical protein